MHARESPDAFTAFPVLEPPESMRCHPGDLHAVSARAAPSLFRGGATIAPPDRRNFSYIRAHLLRRCAKPNLTIRGVPKHPISSHLLRRCAQRSPHTARRTMTVNHIHDCALIAPLRAGSASDLLTCTFCDDTENSSCPPCVRTYCAVAHRTSEVPRPINVTDVSAHSLRRFRFRGITGVMSCLQIIDFPVLR